MSYLHDSMSYEIVCSRLVAILRSAEHRWVVGGMAGAAATLALAAVKAGMGVYATSAFLALNALFSIGAAMAKIIIVRGDGRRQRSAGVLLCAGCLPLAVYCVGMILAGWGSNVHYDTIAGITVATGAFGDLALAVSGIRTARKTNRAHFVALKQVNLASALVMLSLTQVALLSFSSGGAGEAELANGTMGLVCTLAAFGLGANVARKAPSV